MAVLIMNKKRRQFGKICMLNCLLPIIILAIKRRIIGIIWIWPFHFLGITHAGNVIHFRTKRTKDELAPLYFEGRFEIVKGYKPKMP
jgi:hypothetical protein